MKRKSLIIFLLLFLVPILVNAKQIEYNDSKVKFEIDENEWQQTALNQARTYIDKKWTSDCGIIVTGSYDVYSELSSSFLKGYSREYFNYKNLFTSNDFAKQIVDGWKQSYNINNWSYRDYGMKFIYAQGSTIQSGVTVNFDMYLTVNNGYGLMFQFMNSTSVNKTSCTNTINRIVRTVKSTADVKEINDSEDYSVAFLIIGLFFTIICYMAYPFVRTKFMDVEYDEKSCKKMALWNSIIVGGAFLIVTTIVEPSKMWSVTPALFYYYINRTLWISKNKKNNNTQNDNDDANDNNYINENDIKKIKCNNCGAFVNEKDEFCKNCGAHFSNEESSEKNYEVVEDNDNEKKFACEKCGAYVNENDMYCQNCGAKFATDEDDDKEENIELFKCDNCGSFVDKNVTVCPGCGEKFDNADDNEAKQQELVTSMDKKYYDLTKLKELLDKKIITKEEFETEKKKILKEK